MRNIIIDLQNSDTVKIQLTVAINFIFWKDLKEEHVMHANSDSIRLISYNDANEVANKLVESLCSRYQILETSMRRSDFIFDSVQLMYFKCHKVNFKRGA